MSLRAKVISSIVLAAAALVAWRFTSPPVEVLPVKAPPILPEPLATTQPTVETREAAAAPESLPPARQQSAKPVPDPDALNERTLVGTKWARDGFGLEFGADGRLLIGGRERAQWRVEGQRIRLYRDTTGEEHWLDIAGHKLMWEGQEIGRVPTHLE